MTNSMTDAEARLALHEVERGRQRVIDQIGMPRWYWSGGVRVRADVAGRRAPLIVFGFLIALAGVTGAAGFAAYAAGSEHPGTIASVLVAVMILLGGPRVMAAIRARARGAASK